MAKMTGFIFQDAYLERLAKLSDQEVGRLVRALAVYHATGEQQELAGRESVAFDFIKVDIDEVEAKYAAKCETNRNNRQQSLTTDNDRQLLSTTVPKYKYKYKEKDIDEDDDTARARDTAFGTIQADPVILAVQAELTGLTQAHYDDLQAYRETLPDGLIVEAINEAVAHGARSWAYVRSILQTYVKDNIRSVGAARERAERRKQQKDAGKRVNAQNYTQREYTEAELSDNSLLDEALANARSAV